MNNLFLPKKIEKVGIPPIKCQGIKSKLVSFIAENISWDGKGKWIEPFLGSGVVLFNIRPHQAIASDTNKYIINFYKQIQSGKIDEHIVKAFLEGMGSQLSAHGQDFYYSVRKDFNEDGDPLKLLFLNRSCFNGLMRFNSKGGYNVPFGHKPQRFSKAYITKISNQVRWVKHILSDRDWEFRVSDWNDILSSVNEKDFVYLDPPYIGRHSGYFNDWQEKDAINLAKMTQTLPSGFALSMWLENKYRKNKHIENCWNGLPMKTFSHFYHIGSSESLRNKMQEALIINPNCATKNSPKKLCNPTTKQLDLFLPDTIKKESVL